jgi:formate dehydrogenase major subunit
MNGKPWNPDKVAVEWNGTEWIRNDVPDFAFQKANADGTNTPIEPNNKAFFMRWEQNACLFSTNGMKDMPLPEHYEPFESPVKNQMNGSVRSISMATTQ